MHGDLHPQLAAVRLICNSPFMGYISFSKLHALITLSTRYNKRPIVMRTRKQWRRHHFSDKCSLPIIQSNRFSGQGGQIPFAARAVCAAKCIILTLAELLCNEDTILRIKRQPETS